MQFFEHSFSNPEANLALDEALLENAENGVIGETLRVWESSTYFVVLGYSSKWKNEVLVQPCEKDRIPVLRRKSGGATVLQGPGCLNFNLILEASAHSGINSDTKNIMSRHQQIAQSWNLPGNIEIQGISDLTWNGKKFSGNAMRRGKKYFLFHGTFLYQFALEKIQNYLGTPAREPKYRKHRSHTDFLTTIPVSKKQIVDSLRKSWKAEAVLEGIPDHQKIEAEIYSQAEWNLKY